MDNPTGQWKIYMITLGLGRAGSLAVVKATVLGEGKLWYKTNNKERKKEEQYTFIIGFTSCCWYPFFVVGCLHRGQPPLKRGAGFVISTKPSSFWEEVARILICRIIGIELVEYLWPCLWEGIGNWGNTWWLIIYALPAFFPLIYNNNDNKYKKNVIYLHTFQ